MTLTKTILRSDELSCPSCVSNIESKLNQTEGVSGAKVYFSTGRIEVEHDPEIASEEKLIEIVRQSGYEASVSPF